MYCIGTERSKSPGPMKISHGLAEMADVPTTGRDEAPAQVASYWGEKQTLSGGNQGVSGTDPFYGVIMATGGSGAQLSASRACDTSSCDWI